MHEGDSFESLYHKVCPTCGEPLPFEALDCHACGLPLPPPSGLPQRKPWYIQALVVMGVLWVVAVAWYALYVEIPEAKDSQRRENDRARYGRIIPYTPTPPPPTSR